MTSTRPTTAISIVCVFNDPAVREECLDASVAAYDGPVEVEYIPVDNTAHAFSTAGAALNHAVRQARHPVVALVHQDVYLNSLDRVAEVGAMLDERWAVLGANGVRHDGTNTGRIQDRAQLIGESAPRPVAVDSVDEVLFLVRRDLLLAEPLVEDPDLAWHAYAVEYGLRMRRAGREVGAVDLAVTHNSLTANLARLDVAHRVVGERYPELRPIRTTCGTVSDGTVEGGTVRDRALVRRHGWRLRWLRHSLLAARVRRRLDLPVVLSDIRHEIDLLPFDEASPLHLVNVDSVGGFAPYATRELRLHRLGRPVLMRVVAGVPELGTVLDSLPDGARTLVVGLGLEDLARLRERCRADDGWRIGIHPDTVWLLGGVADEELPEQWSRPAAVALGSRRTARLLTPAR